jgi:hypothetical protein
MSIQVRPVGRAGSPVSPDHHRQVRPLASPSRGIQRAPNGTPAVRGPASMRVRMGQRRRASEFGVWSQQRRCHRVAVYQRDDTPTRASYTRLCLVVVQESVFRRTGAYRSSTPTCRPQHLRVDLSTLCAPDLDQSSQPVGLPPTASELPAARPVKTSCARTVPPLKSFRHQRRFGLSMSLRSASPEWRRCSPT